MRADFKEKYGPWAVIAGASEGLGAAFTREIAKAGINVIPIARRKEVLEELAAEVREKYQVEVKPLTLDLAAEDVLEQLRKATDELEIGLVIYNVGLSLIGTFLHRTEEEHLTILNTNCRTQLLFTHHFGSKMKERGRGGVIILSSLAGFQGTAMVAHYAATKAYNRVLAEGLWDEFKPYGVDVLSACAGATATPNYINSKPRKLNPMSPPVMSAEDVVMESLKALGKNPLHITGKWNRLASFFMHRLFSRKNAISTFSKSTRDMYEQDYP